MRKPAALRLAQPVIAMMYAPLYFGAEPGIFAGEGLELEFMTMRTDLAAGRGRIEAQRETARLGFLSFKIVDQL
jgi:hypothetical protein